LIHPNVIKRKADADGMAATVVEREWQRR